MTKTLAAAAAILTASALLIPTASQAADTRSERVAYGDLDLTSSEGRLQLDRRIGRAAASVCEASLAVGVADKQNAAECIAATVAAAKPQSDAVIAAAVDGRGAVMAAASLTVSQ